MSRVDYVTEVVRAAAEQYADRRVGAAMRREPAWEAYRSAYTDGWMGCRRNRHLEVRASVKQWLEEKA